MTERLDKDQMEILRRLLAGAPLPWASNIQDRARQKLRKRGLISFDRTRWQWVHTEDGRAAYVKQVNK